MGRGKNIPRASRGAPLEKRSRTPLFSQPAPRSPHLRSSSGGTAPRREFTHCCSCVIELLRWAIFSGLVRGAKPRRWATLSPSGGGYAVLPGRLGDEYGQPLGWGGRSTLAGTRGASG